MRPPVRRAATGDRRDERPPLKQGSALVDLALMIGAFVVVTLIALALGAANLGTAATFGQIGFAAMLMYVLLRR